MKTVRLVLGLCLLLISLLAIGPSGLALAQDAPQPVADNVTPAGGEPPPEETPIEEPAIVERLTLAPTYPTVEAIAGGTFEYEMKFNYISEKTRVFDMRIKAPQGWTDVYMTPQYEKEKKISSVRLEGGFSSSSYGNTIIVHAMAPTWPLPEPGRYTITVEAVSDTIKSSVELTAVITNKYILNLVPATELYNTTARAGEENIFSVKVQNYGTGAIDNVKFSSEKPEGWEIVFKPEKIDVLDAIDEQSVDVSIKPPPKTIAGDYMITLKTSGQQVTAQDIQVRVTVETPTIWGWVGVAIILVVVIGLIIVFMRFSRR